MGERLRRLASVRPFMRQASMRRLRLDGSKQSKFRRGGDKEAEAARVARQRRGLRTFLKTAPRTRAS